ncbi:MAG: DedA family protein [Bacteroidales bacterium]|jgi:membrane protein DedA with SNARE-associated domain|nr:DedA family protein [Bacteroidales bacterium]
MNRITKCLICVFAFLLSISTVSAQTTQEQQSSQNTPKTEEVGVIKKVTNWYMDNMNYGTVTLLMAVESSFIPFPSEVVVPPAAYKATKPDSGMNVVLVVVFATLGALIGALVNYYLALWLGRPIVYKFAESKLGRLCLLDASKIETAEKYFDKHGKSSTLIGRLVPAVRQLISIPAGLAKMNIVTFLTFTALGAGIWNTILAVLGYIAAGQSDLIDKYSHELSYILIGLGILFVAYLIFKAVRKKKKQK